MRLAFTFFMELRLSHCIMLCDPTGFLTDFCITNNVVIQTVSKQNSCRDLVKSLQFLNLPSIYILETLISYKFKSSNIQTGTDRLHTV